jgi:hypothetical protein
MYMNDYWMVHFKYYIRKKLEKQDGHHSMAKFMIEPFWEIWESVFNVLVSNH